jgi:hypothetical protein
VIVDDMTILLFRETFDLSRSARSDKKGIEQPACHGSGSRLQEGNWERNTRLTRH